MAKDEKIYAANVSAIEKRVASLRHELDKGNHDERTELNIKRELAKYWYLYEYNDNRAFEDEQKSNPKSIQQRKEDSLEFAVAANNSLIGLFASISCYTNDPNFIDKELQELYNVRGDSQWRKDIENVSMADFASKKKLITSAGNHVVNIDDLQVADLFHVKVYKGVERIFGRYTETDVQRKDRESKLGTFVDEKLRGEKDAVLETKASKESRFAVDDASRTLERELIKKDPSLAKEKARKVVELAQNVAKSKVSTMVAACLRGPSFGAIVNGIIISDQKDLENIRAQMRKKTGSIEYKGNTIKKKNVQMDVLVSNGELVNGGKVDSAQMYVAAFLGDGINVKYKEARTILDNYLKSNNISDDISTQYQGATNDFNGWIDAMAQGYFMGYVQVNHALAHHLDTKKMENFVPTRAKASDISVWDEWATAFENYDMVKTQYQNVTENQQDDSHKKQIKKVKNIQKEKPGSAPSINRKMPIRGLLKLYVRVAKFVHSLLSNIQGSGYTASLLMYLERKRGINLPQIGDDPANFDKAIRHAFKVETDIDFLHAQMFAGHSDKAEQYKESCAQLSKDVESFQVTEEMTFEKSMIMLSNVKADLTSDITDAKLKLQLEQEPDQKFAQVANGIAIANESVLAGRLGVLGADDNECKQRAERMKELANAYSRVQDPTQKMHIQTELSEYLSDYSQAEKALYYKRKINDALAIYEADTNLKKNDYTLIRSAGKLLNRSDKGNEVVLSTRIVTGKDNEGKLIHCAFGDHFEKFLGEIVDYKKRIGARGLSHEDYQKIIKKLNTAVRGPYESVIAAENEYPPKSFDR